jgi:hypothetical protein
MPTSISTTDTYYITFETKYLVAHFTAVVCSIPTNNEIHLTGKISFEKITVLRLATYYSYCRFPENVATYLGGVRDL